MALSQNDLRRWVSEKLDRRGRGARIHLAKHMGMSPDQITRMTNWRGEKEKRDISATELSKIVEFFGEPPGQSEEGIPSRPPTPQGAIREIDVRAGMGGGGYEAEEVVENGYHRDPVKSEAWQFPPSFVRQELRAPTERIVIIETQGDSMLPTISPGERVVVDTGHILPSPDGIYALRDRFGGIVVKRLQVMRRGDPPVVRVISDNPNHSAEDVGADEIQIVGRVIFGLKRY